MKRTLALAAVTLVLITLTAMAQTPVNLAQNQVFQPGDTTTASATVPAGINGAMARFTAGPMADPATHFIGRVLVDRNDGKGFVDVGVGLEGWGGLMSTTRGGPATTPVTIFGTTNMPLQPGWKFEAQVHIDGTATVTASITVTPY